MNGDKLEEKGGKLKENKWLIFFSWLFQVDKLDDEPKLGEWSVSVVTTTALITIVYMLVKKHNWESAPEKVSIVSISTALPLLTFTAIFILEIIGGIRKMFLEKMLEEERKAELQKAVQEAMEQGKIIGASEKQKEWEEWADNGREESDRPKSPNPQNSDKIKV